MKRLFFILIPLFLIVFICLFSNFTLSSLIIGDNSNLKRLDLGFIVEEFVSHDYKVYKDNGKVVGECVRVSGDNKDLKKIASKIGFTLTKKYKVGETFLFEGVSPKLKFSLNNRQENVQIALSNGTIIIASPIIYGSY